MSGEKERTFADAEYSSCQTSRVCWRIIRLEYERGNLSYSAAVYLWRAACLAIRPPARCRLCRRDVSAHPPELDAAPPLGRPRQTRLDLVYQREHGARVPNRIQGGGWLAQDIALPVARIFQRKPTASNCDWYTVQNSYGRYFLLSTSCEIADISCNRLEQRRYVKCLLYCWVLSC